MKRMTKAALIIAAVTSSSTVLAKETRFVVTQKLTTNKNEVQSLSSREECYQHSNGSWCLPVQQGQNTSLYDVNGKLNKIHQYESSVHILNTHGKDARKVAELLTEDGRFGIVEVDIPVTTKISKPTVMAETTSTTNVNDGLFSLQEEYLGSVKDNIIGMGVSTVWEEYGFAKSDEPLDVVVIDSSFNQHEDLEYHGGFSTTTVPLVTGGEKQTYSNDFRPRPESIEQGICDGHGLGVAGVIGSTINNELGSAGISNDINVYALRALSCGAGFLSSTRDAIEWSLGAEFEVEGEVLNTYEGNPGVINISLSTFIDDFECPTFMQITVDKAIEAGWVLVASSGNDGANVEDSAPANCDGVISVGSLARTGERAGFSNFGESLDLVAQGTSIMGPCGDSGSNENCAWSGTSFSSPLIAGMAAIIKKQTGLSNQEITLALKVTANTSTFKNSPECDLGECGAGVPNLPLALKFAERLANGEKDKMTFAANEDSPCETIWFSENFPSLPICSLYKVEFLGGEGIEGSTFKLLSKSKALEWSDAIEVNEFDTGVGYIRDVNTEAQDYGYQICTNGNCTETVLEISTDLLTEENTPSICR